MSQWRQLFRHLFKIVIIIKIYCLWLLVLLSLLHKNQSHDINLIYIHNLLLWMYICHLILAITHQPKAIPRRHHQKENCSQTQVGMGIKR